MRIYASRRDDILKRKADYEADFAKRKAQYDDQYDRYRNEVDIRADQLAEEVKHAIPKTSLDIQVSVRQNFSFRDEPGYEIIISDEIDKFNPDKPLSWTWRVKLDGDGNIAKESSSWSGLQATTDIHIEKLKEIVEVLQALNRIDWQVVLNRITPPKYGDYVTMRDPSYDRDKPNFDQELLEADIEDIIGTNKGILSYGSKYYRGEVYRVIVKQTPAQFTVYDVPATQVESDGAVKQGLHHWNTPYTIRKTTFYNDVVKPVKIQELF